MSTEVSLSCNSPGPWEDTTGFCGVWIISGTLPPGLDLTLLNNVVSPALMIIGLPPPPHTSWGWVSGCWIWVGGHKRQHFQWCSKHFSRGQTKRQIRKIWELSYPTRDRVTTVKGLLLWEWSLRGSAQPSGNSAEELGDYLSKRASVQQPQFPTTLLAKVIPVTPLICQPWRCLTSVSTSKLWICPPSCEIGMKASKLS